MSALRRARDAGTKPAVASCYLLRPMVNWTQPWETMDKEFLIRTRTAHLIAVMAGLVLILFYSAAHAQTSSGDTLEGFTALVVHLTAEPEAVLPGEALSYVVLLENSSGIDHQVSLSITLPSRFELPLTALPAGASYQVRSGNVQWSGLVTASSAQRLVFPGRTPSDPGSDGSLTATMSLAQQPVAVIDTQSEALGPAQFTNLSVTGWVGTPPTADFAYTVTGQSVQLSNLSQGVGPLSIWWDLGDGTTSTEPNPSHVYQQSGSYVIQLTSANPKGTSTATQIVHLTSPTTGSEGYAILVDDDTPAVGQMVNFGNATEPLLVTFQWSFGDGASSEIRSPSHSYSLPGVYTVTRVLGEGTVSIQSSLVLEVGYPPEATIQASKAGLSVGELVNLTAVTNAPDPLGYFWDLGDGSTAGSSSIGYSYGAPGVYPVTVAVSNDFGVALDTITLRIGYPTVYLPIVISGSRGVPPAEGEPAAAEDAAKTAPTAELPADPSAREMLQSINREREANGLAPLNWSDQLTRSAQHHSDDMATHWFTGHSGSDGTHPVDRMRQASYTGDYAGECTAWGFDDFASALAWWMTSPPHRVIILSTVATEVGGAHSLNPDSPSVDYWTIDFGAARAN